MSTITIDVECRAGLLIKHFCTMVCDVSEVHKALMDSVNFITAICWEYIGHTITVNESRENLLKKETEIGIDVLTAMKKSAELVKNSPQHDFSCVTSLFGEEEHEDWHRTTEWHKDSDETPNDAKRYLVFRNSESGRRSFCIGWYDCTHDGDLLWHEDDGNDIIWDVIFWTELPEEPYEKGEEE